MKKVIRLTESDLSRLVKRVIREAPEMTNTSISIDRLPRCKDLMKNTNDMAGSNMLLPGSFDKLTGNFLVAPMYQGYVLHKNGKEFCFIKG